MLRFFAVPLAAFLLSGTTSAGQDLYDDTVLRTLNLQFHDANYWQKMVNDKKKDNGNYTRADLTVDGVFYPDVGVRMRGKASFLFANEWKLPFKIKMDAFLTGQKLYGYGSLRLNNAWEDPTFCRDVAMANLLQDFTPVPRSNFVVLTINGENWGVYVNEQQKDGRFMREWYRADTGNRYKSVVGGNLSYLGSDPGPYMSQYDNQADDNPDPYTDLIHFCDVLNNTPTGSGLTDALRPILDLDSTIWQIASDNVFGNGDSYYFNRNNYYVIHDDHHDLLELVNHDLGLSFGTWDGLGPSLDPLYKFTSTLTPLVKQMFVDNKLKREYLAHVRTFAEELFRPDIVLPMFARYRQLIQAEVYADDKKIYSDQDFDDNFSKSVRGIFFNIPGIEPYVTGRHLFLTSHAELTKPQAEFESVGHSPEYPLAGDTVQMLVTIAPGTEAKSLELRWRTQGPFQITQMFDDGQHGDGQSQDGVFGVTLPPQQPGTRVEYFFVSRAKGSRAFQFEPPRGPRWAYSYQVQGSSGFDVVLNEFMAKNDNGVKDENGEREDWVELHHRGAAAVDLSGMYLTCDLATPTEWSFPAGSVLNPGERLLLWADDENDGPYHLNFKLDADGEEIALVAADGVTVHDFIAYGPQQADVSTARLFDGDPRWVTLRDPTPSESNEPDCGLRHFSALDPSANPIDLEILGTPDEGETITLQLSNGPPGASTVLFVGFGPDISTRPGGGVLLIQLVPAVAFNVPLDATGSATLSALLPNDGSLLGIDLYLQDFAPGAGGLILSNAAHLEVCQ